MLCYTVLCYIVYCIKSSCIVCILYCRFIALPAWSPVISLESIDGSTWRDMRTNFDAILAVLPPISELQVAMTLLCLFSTTFAISYLVALFDTTVTCSDCIAFLIL